MIDEIPLVVDANILIRGAFAIQVRSLIRGHPNSVNLYTAEICEDVDFFGCGVATWNTRNLETYLRNA